MCFEIVSNYNIWYPQCFIFLALYAIFWNEGYNKKWFVISEREFNFMNGFIIASMIFIVTVYMKFSQIWNDLLYLKEVIDKLNGLE